MTCAAVTTSPGAATQPEPEMPSPHAVPITRTTLGEAARTTGFLSTARVGGSVGIAGPATVGNGSTRARTFRSCSGGTRSFSRLSTSDRWTLSRSDR